MCLCTHTHLFLPPTVAQSVKHVTLGFSSGQDLRSLDIKPHMGLCGPRLVC